MFSTASGNHRADLWPRSNYRGYFQAAVSKSNGEPSAKSPLPGRAERRRCV